MLATGQMRARGGQNSLTHVYFDTFSV